jgi:2-isopropylmalate synthase
MQVVRTADEAGADCVVLCDTNGGTLTSGIREVTREVCSEVDARVGIHCHDDSGLGVANSVAAVEEGCRHVQGTLNGFGERCGNADLCAVIPNLNLKTDYRCTTDEQQKKLTEISRLAYEVANLMFRGDQPYVGHSAFAHKGGLHVDAMRKERRSYEHVDPTLVGNERRFLIGELSGKASLLEKMEKYDLSHDSETLSRLLERVQRMENRGYQFEAAEASFELLAKKETGNYRRFFESDGYHVSIMRQPEGGLVTDATVKLNVKGRREHTASEGDGPVDALDGALRRALEEHYPSLDNVHLTDYKVRVINPREATAAKVRVIVQSADDNRMWGTVGVSENIIEASWEALVDSIEYKLLLEEEKKQKNPDDTA